MEFIGSPLVMQNTDSQGWLVTLRDAVSVSNNSDGTIETISFTVSVPRRPDLSISEVQTLAMKRAAELLQVAIQGGSTP